MRQSKLLKPIAHGLLALPLLWSAVQFYFALTGAPHSLGANPVEHSIRYLGIWALRLLILCLAISPMARLTGYRQLVSLRRAVGLWAFAYATCHLAVYQLFDLELSLAALWAEVLKRKFITLGMLAFVLLIPLAATSTAGMIRRLGARNWQRLHKAVYAIGLLGGLHFLFMRKGNQPEPKIYLALIAALLALRLFFLWQDAQKRQRRPGRRPA
jgi:methionine sulfoxide reductase heme-binding subunit